MPWGREIAWHRPLSLLMLLPSFARVEAATFGPGGEWVTAPPVPISHSVRAVYALGDVVVVHDFDDFEGGYGILWAFDGNVWTIS